jgi:hypothetical protein
LRTARQPSSIPARITAGQNTFRDEPLTGLSAIDFCLMLLDIALACAPIVAVLPAAIAVLTRHVSYAPKSHLQKRLYGALLLNEKLPAGALGAQQIARDIDRQTLRVAYVAQYPHRTREVVDIAAIGIGAVFAFVVYYFFLWADASLLYLLALLAIGVIATLWFERAVVNFGRNDVLVHELFEYFGAPDSLVRPHTELVLKAPALTVEAVFERAADVRDAQYDGSMTTLEAINSVLAQAHSHVIWRREARRLAYRSHAKTVWADTVPFAASSYDWLLRHLLGPFFNLRLAYLDSREQHRVDRAEKTGDVYKVAWLHTHYRNERTRLARHWTYLHGARDPLLKWSGDGATRTAPLPRDPSGTTRLTLQRAPGSRL